MIGAMILSGALLFNSSANTTPELCQTVQLPSIAAQGDPPLNLCFDQLRTTGEVLIVIEAEGLSYRAFNLTTRSYHTIGQEI